MAKINKINLHAGHCEAGKVACGAVGILDESKENRKVLKYLKEILKKNNVTVYDCTVNTASNPTDCLKKIINKNNAHSADLDVSIHFNSGANDKKGNGKTTGTEVLVYKNSGIRANAAKAVRAKIANLGFKDRGTKIDQNLYFLHRSKNPAILIECCFVDDKDDAKIYDAKKMAQAIAGGLLSINI